MLNYIIKFIELEDLKKLGVHQLIIHSDKYQNRGIKQEKNEEIKEKII